MGKVKIRYREVIVQRPHYGRFPEHQVVLGRKILSRHDLRSQAEKWAESNGYEIENPFSPTPDCRHPNSCSRHQECMYLGCSGNRH